MKIRRIYALLMILILTVSGSLPVGMTAFPVMGADGVIATGLSQDVTGSMGMFYAMVIAVFAILLYSKLAKVRQFEIHMPDSVPANVGKAFSSLIPTCLTIIILCAVRFAFFSFTGMELNELVYKVLQAPLGAIVQTPFGFIGIALFASLFWVFGIHGTAVTSAITRPLFLAALTKNIDLVNSGAAPTEIVTKPFNVIFGGMGGFGCTLGLIVAILLFPPLYASAIFPGRITLGGIRAALITGSAMILLLYPLYYTDHLKFHPAMLGVPAAGAALFLFSARERRAL